jgi:hypothetical protein
MGFSKDELKEITKMLLEQGTNQEKLNNSVKDYIEHLKTIRELQKTIQHVEKQIKDLEDEKKDILKKLLKNRQESKTLSGVELKKNQDIRKELWEQVKAKNKSIQLTKAGLEAIKETTNEYIKQAKEVNKVHLGLKEANKALRKVPGLLNKGYGKLKGTGIFDLEKSARMAAMEMGIVAKNTNGFRQNIYKAAESTLMMGAGVKDLAKMQAAYSTHLGRTTQLSQEGLEAMTEMAKGTTLGLEGVAAFAAEMERFNVSAVDSAGMVGEIMNMSQKIGINGNKVLKSLQNNLKMANKYHFKGGINGMAKMAAMAEKFNISMDATAGMADQLFDIEGAVEMSAKLNTMGGEWAKLGDPMKLMFQARNDMEGLQESVINATAGMADFNKETGEVSFSGLELHRMRELEKITGISADKMAEMAKQQAKFNQIRGQMAGTGISDEMMEFVETQAQFNKKSGKFEIKLEGSEKAIPVNELKKVHEQELVNTQKSLKVRAEQTQTFDDTLKATIEEMKLLLLPVLEGVNEVLPQIRKTVKSFMKSGWADKLKQAAKKIGDVVGGAIKWFMELPTMLKVGLGVLTLAAPWIAAGWSLGKGFLLATRGFGGMLGGGGGGGKGGGGPMGWMGNQMTKTRRFTKAGGGLSGKMGKFGKSMAGKGMGIGMIGGLGSMALDYGRGMMDNEQGGAGKAMGVASGALGGAATGAMIGSVVPVIGTAVGAIVGGLVGGIYSAVQEYGGPEAGSVGRGSGINDGILADGKITPIDSKDKVFEISRPGGAYDKAVNDKPGLSSTNSSVKVHISFDTLKVDAGGNEGAIDLENDSAFIRELATKVKEALSQTANGGVLNPNPS